MMQESARLPPLHTPTWTPPTISSTNVGGGSGGAGKRARGSEVVNGHHSRPRPHTIHHQDSVHFQSPVRSQTITTTLPHQSPPLTSLTHTTLTDIGKSQVDHKRLSEQVPITPTVVTSSNVTDKGRERWGGWLGGSFNSQRGRSDSSKQCANSAPLQTSELRSSGFDMTKLYPELSAKLGLTKHTPSDTTGTHKNGINLKDSFTSGSLKKLEHVSDDSRIKVVSTGQIVNNAKGLLTNKLCGGVQSVKNNVKSSKSKSKSSEKGQRKGGQSRGGGRGDSVSSGTILTSLPVHTPTSITSKGLSSPSAIRSSSNLNCIKTNTINASSILEEQLRGGILQRHNTSGQSLHQSRLPQLSPSKSVPAASPLPALSSGGRSLVRAPSTHSAPPTQKPKVVTLTPRPPPQSALTTTTAATLPHTLLRVHALREKYYAYNSDLFPLGIETSEESDGSDTDDVCGSQQGWLDPTDGSCERYQSWVNNVDELSGRQKYNDHISGGCQRSATLGVALSSLRRRVSASRVRSEVRAWESERRDSLTQSLVVAARTHPRLTADACHLFRTPHTTQESPKNKSRLRSAVLQRRECAYNDGEGGSECREASLPGTRHCMRHIMYNVDQQLFTHCTARLPDNTPCRIPVFDVSHELPLCYKHSKTQEYVVKTSEEITKPKRSRKKNKMPILSRYGKRSKKRRRSSNSASSVIPSTSVRPPMASQTSLSSPQPSPTTPQTSPHFSTASYTDSVAEGEESEFEEEMEDMVDDLDCLTDRNLQDVLTRIPVHEFSQLFDVAEGKTEEFVSGAEEKAEAESEVGDDDDQSVRSATPAQSPATVAVTSTTTTSLPLNEDANTTLSLDESTINDLVAGNIPIDSIISSSFNQQELNTISQALSNIVQESNINLAVFDLSSTNSFSETGGSGPVGDVSDNSLMSQASDGVGQGDISESGRPVSECKTNLLTPRSGIVGDSTLSPLK